MTPARLPAAVAALLAAIALSAGLAATAVAGTPHDPSAEASVVGGRPASITEFPSLAFVEGIDEEGPFSCTGTVVAPRVVLTAGHCIEAPNEFAANPPTSYLVTTGVADLAKAQPVNLSRVSRTIFFPNFETANPQIDAGLLILSAPVGAPALAIATPSEPELRKAGTPISIAGWGVTTPRAEAVPKVLRAGELAVQSTGYCRRHVFRLILDFPAFTPSSQICALDRPRHRTSGCFGDSGGPAIAHRADGTPVEVGIIIKGGFECSRKLPNIYTRVDRISAWVSSWIAFAEQGGPVPPTPMPAPPYLSFFTAEDIAAAKLTHTFRAHFRRGTAKRIGCARLAWTRVRCRVAWHQGGNHYFGTLTVSQVVTRKLSVASMVSYRIHWAREGCGSQRRHPRGCAVHTKSAQALVIRATGTARPADRRRVAIRRPG